MMDEKTNRCLIVGIGKMGLAHLRALKYLNLTQIAVWAPTPRGRQIVEEAEAKFFCGPIEKAISTFEPTHAIVASPVETLALISKQLIIRGVKNILIEKPGILNYEEGSVLRRVVDELGANVFVAYNRRFYASIQTALKMIKRNSDSILSVNFEFNERIIDQEKFSGYHESVRQKWIIANSMHVLDSVFFPVGLPDFARSCFIQEGEIPWHSAGSLFVGSGLTDRSVPFSYHANWNAPGRWSFQWMTRDTRYIFSPIEELKVMTIDNFEVKNVTLEEEQDINFKPGVINQDLAFIGGPRGEELVSLNYALSLLDLGVKIAGYPIK